MEREKKRTCKRMAVPVITAISSIQYGFNIHNVGLQTAIVSVTWGAMSKVIDCRLEKPRWRANMCEMIKGVITYLIVNAINLSIRMVILKKSKWGLVLGSSQLFVKLTSNLLSSVQLTMERYAEEASVFEIFGSITHLFSALPDLCRSGYDYVTKTLGLSDDIVNHNLFKTDDMKTALTLSSGQPNRVSSYFEKLQIIVDPLTQPLSDMLNNITEMSILEKWNVANEPVRFLTPVFQQMMDNLKTFQPPLHDIICKKDVGCTMELNVFNNRFIQTGLKTFSQASINDITHVMNEITDSDEQLTERLSIAQQGVQWSATLLLLLWTLVMMFSPKQRVCKKRQQFLIEEKDSEEED